MKLRHSIISLLGLLCIPFVARGHYLWIESDTPAEARVYFGEIAEGVKEKAGGRLDERDAIQGRIERGERPVDTLSLAKKADHFLIPSQEGNGWLVVQDLAGEVKDWTKSDIGIVKPMFYARAAIANKITAAKPTLTLDVLPDLADPHVLSVFFKQQPLPSAKVLVYAPNMWMQELQADASGQVKIATPWPGRYVVDVIYKEREAGEFQGKQYEAIRHRATFTLNY